MNGDDVRTSLRGLNSSEPGVRAASSVAYHLKTKEINPEWLHQGLRDVMEWSTEELHKFSNLPRVGVRGDIAFGMTHTGIIRVKRDCFDTMGCKQSGHCSFCPVQESKCCRKGWKLDPNHVNDPTLGEGCGDDEGCVDAHCCVGNLTITPVKDLDVSHLRLQHRVETRRKILRGEA